MGEVPAVGPNAAVQEDRFSALSRMEPEYGRPKAHPLIKHSI